MVKLKIIIKKIVPPIAFDILKLLKSKKIRYGFKGNYSNWNQAVTNSIGWNSDNIIKKVSESTLLIKNNVDFFERDGEIIKSTNYNFPVLACLLRSIDWKKHKLAVIDFGGSFGSHYFRFKHFFDPALQLTWSVVEQKQYVEHAQNNFKNPELNFHTSISDALVSENAKVFFSSGTIQYLENPHEFIRDLLDKQFDFIILDRIFFIENQTDRIVVQDVNPELFYEASFPAWLFNETNFIKTFLKKYKLSAEFFSEDPDNEIEGIRIYHKGFFFKRI